MNEQYTVIRAFRDKYDNQNYNIGQNYNAEDQARAEELESGGYIAPSNSIASKDAMSQRQMGKAEAQKLAQAHLQAASNAEPKTVVNGKVVPLRAAQYAEAAFNASEESAQTGIKEHHDNTTEAVQAGQVAKNQNQSNQARNYSNALENMQAQNESAAVKQSNMQSAQAHLQQHMDQAQQELKQMQQAEQQAMQQQQQGQQQQGQQSNQAQTDAAGMAALKTNPMAAAHEEAAEAATAAEELKSKAARTNTKKQGQ